MEEKYKGPERRESARLEQDIPVEYNFIDDVKSKELSKKKKGLIRNISAEGGRLEVDELEEAWMEGLYSGLIKLGLEIKLPGEQRTLRAIAKVVWLTKALQESDLSLTKYILGLEFLDITTSDQDTVRNYVINFYLGE
jgi:c-di-GMP-binding flagellar brake protein YcgR